MRKFIQHINEQSKAFLSFNYAERRGISVLVILILLVEGVNAVLPSLVEKEKYDISAFEEELKLFEIALSQPDTLERKTQKKKTYQTKTYPSHSNKKATPARPSVMIEINTADSADLVGLYGIGAVFADRILKYRGLLGGFHSSEQLLEVYGMDSVRYNGIRKNIKVDKGYILKIPVNDADFKSLLKHPYLDYETVKSIVNYRDRNDSIPNDSVLQLVIAYDPLFEKVREYICYKTLNSKPKTLNKPKTQNPKPRPP